MLRLGAHMP